VTPSRDAPDGPADKAGADATLRPLIGALLCDGGGRPLGRVLDILADPTTGALAALTFTGPDGAEQCAPLDRGLRWDGLGWQLASHWRAEAPHAPHASTPVPFEDWMHGMRATAALHDRQGGTVVAEGTWIDASVVIGAARAGVLHLLEAAPALPGGRDA
jgi:hypothetical protein